jgi:hypothetical protein
MQHHIISANAAAGQIVVTYSQDGINFASYNIDVPIIEGVFISGDALHAYLDTFAPVAQVLREEVVAQATGFAAIAALVPPPSSPTVSDYTDAVQDVLDAKAHERNYDGILSACTYATSTVAKFQAEGQACVEWRDAVWASCYATLAQVQGGTLAQPTVQELLDTLPELTWPA